MIFYLLRKDRHYLIAPLQIPLCTTCSSLWSQSLNLRIDSSVKPDFFTNFQTLRGFSLLCFFPWLIIIRLLIQWPVIKHLIGIGHPRYMQVMQRWKNTHSWCPHGAFDPLDHMNEWDGACVEGFDLIREIREGFPEEVVLELGSEG